LNLAAVLTIFLYFYPQLAAHSAGPDKRSETLASSKPNRLISGKSPYLLQYADNPVDWYPWGEDAFEKARQENKVGKL